MIRYVVKEYHPTQDADCKDGDIVGVRTIEIRGDNIRHEIYVQRVKIRGPNPKDWRISLWLPLTADKGRTPFWQTFAAAVKDIKDATAGLNEFDQVKAAIGG